jgi:hypothetical protein
MLAAALLWLREQKSGFFPTLQAFNQQLNKVFSLPKHLSKE